MFTRTRTTTNGAIALMAVATLVAAAGCSSSKSTPSGSTGGTSATSAKTTADPALAGLVPQTFKTKGEVSFGTDPSYAPNEFKDDKGNIIGFDIDLGNAVAAKLGLKAKFTEAAFDNILAGVTSGNFDAGLSSVTDSKDREGKGFEMVNYLNVGTKLMVKKGNPEGLKPDDLSLCGKNVGVEDGTIQKDEVEGDRADKCKAAGKPAPIAVVQPTQTDVNTALTAGRSDAVLADDIVVDYFAKNGPFDSVGASYGPAPYGIVTTKGNDPLAQAFLGALKSMKADGSYAALLAKWNITVAKYDNFGIDQATS